MVILAFICTFVITATFINTGLFRVVIGIQNSTNRGLTLIKEQTSKITRLGLQTSLSNLSGPYIDDITPTIISVIVGSAAYLTCHVRNLGNKTVSWIRHRDVHILTVGDFTYTSDTRFQVIHRDETQEWTLKISKTQSKDAGLYECQLSTEPIVSYLISLHIIDRLSQDLSPKPCPCEPKNKEDVHHTMVADTAPKATILGEPNVYVNKGSTINLTCVIRFSPEPPDYVFWFHQDDVISYDSNRGGISVITNTGSVTISYLLIEEADFLDSGIYSCKPSTASKATIQVHVLKEDSAAAMQISSAVVLQESLFVIFLMVHILQNDVFVQG